ncbi:hypothetical protein EV182_008616, partial [Spiromyces aspiralis]
MVCWLGTYGINEHTRRKEDGGGDDSKLKELIIRRWRYGSFANIASDKRMQLNSSETFEVYILAGFNPALKDHELLMGLASELRATLIDREGDPDCKGSVKKPKRSGPLVDLELCGSNNNNCYSRNKGLVDPFEQRAKHWKTISVELLG